MPQLQLSLPHNIDPDKYFSGHIIQRTQEGNKNLDMLKMQSGWEIFTLCPIAYVTVDFKKVVGDPFDAGSTVAESESIEKKMGLFE